jgi:hypothetical protein
VGVSQSILFNSSAFGLSTFLVDKLEQIEEQYFLRFNPRNLFLQYSHSFSVIDDGLPFGFLNHNDFNFSDQSEWATSESNAVLPECRSGGLTVFLVAH